MCECASFILTKTNEYWCDSDSHEATINAYHLHNLDDLVVGLVRTSMIPPLDDEIQNLDKWKFRKNQDIYPEWTYADDPELEARTRAALCMRAKNEGWFLVKCGDNVSVGWEGTAVAGRGGTATAGCGGASVVLAEGESTAGDYGTATSGESGKSTVGRNGSATAGDYGTATSADNGISVAGYRGVAISGREGVSITMVHGVSTAGMYGRAISGEYGNSTTLDYGISVADNCGIAVTGKHGTATVGYSGSASAGYAGTAIAGVNGRARAGVGGTIIISSHDGNSSKIRKHVAIVGKRGIKPDTWYHVVNCRIVEVEDGKWTIHLLEAW